MGRAQRPKRVFGIEIEHCPGCGGRLQIIASIEEPEVIARILSHLERTAPEHYPPALPLVLAIPAFRLHQHIAFGSTFGEHHAFGLRAYLTAFAN